MEHCLAYEKNYPFLTMAHKPLQEPPMACVSVLFHHFLTYVPQTARERFFLFLRQAILTCPSLLCSLIVLLDLLAAFSYHSNLYFSFISLCFYFLSEGYIDYIIHIILFFLPHYHYFCYVSSFVHTTQFAFYDCLIFSRVSFLKPATFILVFQEMVPSKRKSDETNAQIHF